MELDNNNLYKGFDFIGKRILVVGGNGFLGGHIVRKSFDLGMEVTNLSLNTNRYFGNEMIHFRQADIIDFSSVEKAIGKDSYDYVVNCAGYINHSPFSKEGEGVFKAHFQGVINLFKVLDKKRLQGFVNIGSSDEYGNIPSPQSELNRESPISPYSFAKLATTHFLQMQYLTEGFPATVLRLFLTYGPNQDNKRFIPQVIEGCLRNQPFPVSIGTQLRDFCYIDDTMNAVFLALIIEAAKGEVFNIASGTPVAINEIIRMIKEILGKGQPEFGKIPFRSGENMRLYANIEKAAKILHWQPSVTLNDGLKTTIDWYCQNQIPI